MLDWLFDSSPFVTRPECGGWTEGLIWLTVTSDALIWLAYMAIPFILFQVGRHREDFPYRWILWLFVAFILSCGFTHFFDMLTFYDPHYRLSGVIRALTAAISLATVAALVPVTPRLLSMKSPETLQREIDRRTKVEEELRAAHAELERRVEERTKELVELNESLQREIKNKESLAQALRQKTTELETSNKELEEFAYVASHDLQEPLRKVSSFGELLEEELGVSLEGDARMYLDRMLSASDRMGGMIQDLLQLSRSSKGAYNLRSEDLSAIAGRVLDDLETSIREADAEVTLEDLPQARVDRVQIEQVFRNLIGNAIKYRRKDTPLRVNISGRVVNGDVEISVRDNGIGFEQQFAERIFKPFQRLHGRAEYEGSGIGLALCGKIVERHGGRIEAEGNLGEGAVFRFTLPSGEEQA